MVVVVMAVVFVFVFVFVMLTRGGADRSPGCAIVTGIASPLHWLWRGGFRRSPTGVDAVLADLFQRR
jgi:hypothetical protein